LTNGIGKTVLDALTPAGRGVFGVLTSMVTTIVCLALLMVLVVACTLAQVDLGTLGAVNVYMRSWVVFWDVPRTDLMLPVLPGGATVGVVLAANLIAVQLKRLELSWKKVGIWIAHAGLILLFAGEFVSGAMQVETRLAIEQGQTVNFVESPREQELVIADTSNASWDDVYGVPERLLAKGGSLPIPGTPLTLRVLAFYPNAQLRNRAATDPAPPATMGVGAPRTTRATWRRRWSSRWPAAGATEAGWSPTPWGRRSPSSTRGTATRSACGRGGSTCLSP
jgi:hypothetical protein